MKKVLFMVFIFHSMILCHQQHVHQYFVREAYELLKMYVGYDIPTLRQWIKFEEGFYGPGPWQTGYIDVGAWREDNEDVVFKYSNANLPEGASGQFFTSLIKAINGQNEYYSSVTHFWHVNLRQEGTTFCDNNNKSYPQKGNSFFQRKLLSDIDTNQGELSDYTISDNKLITSSKKIFANVGIGIKYFLNKPSVKHYANNSMYKPKFLIMIGCEIPLTKEEKQFFVTEIKYFKSADDPGKFTHFENVYVMTLHYKYKFKAIKKIFLFPQLGFVVLTNFTPMMFAYSLDLGIEYSLTDINFFIKNSYTSSFFPVTYLPSFLVWGITIKF